MLARLHAIAGLLAGVTILTFWLSTVAVELGGNAAAMTTVKTAIPWGLLLLIPSLALTGATGFRLAGNRRDALVQAKRRRIPIIAANGLLVLVPAAFFLAWRASAGLFDDVFYAVQAVELLAGAVNLALIGLNLRDGLRASGRLHGAT
ncbi:MAG: hypothetical protein ACTS10_06485 [Kiloniellales bacterium]